MIEPFSHLPKPVEYIEMLSIYIGKYSADKRQRRFCSDSPFHLTSPSNRSVYQRNNIRGVITLKLVWNYYLFIAQPVRVDARSCIGTVDELLLGVPKEWMC